ncbi:hypothetical protein BI049_gp015 [Salmonella phage vB_SnwM_CGG4-1]|uniref:Uncharacterized protein n=1 Tax=Salmonella phage vB_SnwM_CGG4-1 TaxID=1815631 RepID=A0A1B0VV04_9CAUD|nr:hypothetical protein BI049_gp015 [Salmonella phage vB_SnwM_CGG4-1]ANA49369.1 hypothetical protein CGG41_015 [Salmonella phage vB_SnwM_CGG4-1]
MHYGYMLVYKDKDGYEIPLYHSFRGNLHGASTVFSNEADAEHMKNSKLVSLKEILRLGKKSVGEETKWLFFKRNTIIYIPVVDETERRNIQQIINTLHVKRVKIA